MKLNKLKKAPRKKGADPAAEFVDALEEQTVEAQEKEQLLLQKVEFLARLLTKNEFNVELVDDYDFAKDTVSLKLNIDETKKFLDILRENRLRTFKDLKNYPVDLTLFDNNHSLHGKLFLTKISSDEIKFSMKIERNEGDSDNIIKNEINRQIVNQNKIGNSAYATVRLITTTYPANSGKLMVKPIDDVQDRPSDGVFGKKSGRVANGEIELSEWSGDLPDIRALKALEEAGYRVVLEGKTGEVVIVHAQFGGVKMKRDVNTNGELRVEIREVDLVRNVYNGVSGGLSRVVENVNYRTNLTKRQPAMVFNRKISKKHTLIKGGAVVFRDFDELAKDLKEKYTETTQDGVVGVARLSGQGGGWVYGEMVDVTYDVDSKKLRLKLKNPVYEGLDLFGENVGSAECAIGTFGRLHE
jgi:hypothetical protein